MNDLEIIAIIEGLILENGGEISIELEYTNFLGEFFDRYHYPETLNDSIMEKFKISEYINSDSTIQQIIEVVQQIE